MTASVSVAWEREEWIRLRSGSIVVEVPPFARLVFCSQLHRHNVVAPVRSAIGQ